MRKKLLICMMACILLIGECVFAVKAAGTPAIELSAAECVPGGTVEIAVSIRNNPGIVSMTLNAHWKYNSFVITFNANAGAVDPSSMEAVSGVAISDLPTPTRTYHIFDGWFTDPIGGTQITDGYVFDQAVDVTLYAHWTLNSYVITFNANEGTVGTTTLRGYCGQAIGTLPTPTRDYYNFNGWFTQPSGGTKITDTYIATTAADFTVYAQWTLKPLSDWVSASDVPGGAQVVENKWRYTRTQNTESTSSSMSGWTQTGNYWSQTDTGSTNYATFPSGYDTNNTYYKTFARSAYTAYDDGSTKREVSNNWAGYVYWHWMYDNGGYTNNTYQTISHRKGEYDIYGNSGHGSSYYAYQYFFAMTSSVDCPYLDNFYCCSQSLKSYNCHSIITDKATARNPRCFRFSYYTSTYTDYVKMYQYQKIENNLESMTVMTNGGEISNVEHLVRYRSK